MLLNLQNHNPGVHRFKLEVPCWDKVSYFNTISDSDTQIGKRQKKNILLIA